MVSIVDVDGDNEIYPGASVAIHCIDAGADEGAFEYGGIVLLAADIDWPLR